MMRSALQTPHSATSHDQKSTSGLTFRMFPVARLSKPETECPSATSRSARCEPMNPAAPVIRILIEPPSGCGELAAMGLASFVEPVDPRRLRYVCEPRASGQRPLPEGPVLPSVLHGRRGHEAIEVPKQRAAHQHRCGDEVADPERCGIEGLGHRVPL